MRFSLYLVELGSWPLLIASPPHRVWVRREVGIIDRGVARFRIHTITVEFRGLYSMCWLSHPV